MAPGWTWQDRCIQNNVWWNKGSEGCFWQEVKVSYSLLKAQDSREGDSHVEGMTQGVSLAHIGAHWHTNMSFVHTHAHRHVCFFICRTQTHTHAHTHWCKNKAGRLSFTACENRFDWMCSLSQESRGIQRRDGAVNDREMRLLHRMKGGYLENGQRYSRTLQLHSTPYSQRKVTLQRSVYWQQITCMIWSQQTCLLRWILEGESGFFFFFWMWVRKLGLPCFSCQI